MSWRARTARALVDGLRPGLSETAALAVVTADGEGYTVESSGRCPADGRFEIGSITKTMTGTVLASLVDDGIVDLDDEIGRWLDAGESADITLRQLATHTSGLPRLSPSHVAGAPDPYAFLTAQVVEAELRKAGSGPRGVEHDYSNFGFQVLGLVLERADRTAFADLLEHRVLIPLGMACSGIPGRGGGAVITGYAQGAPAERWYHHLWGAGGVEWPIGPPGYGGPPASVRCSGSTSRPGGRQQCSSTTTTQEDWPGPCGRHWTRAEGPGHRPNFADCVSVFCATSSESCDTFSKSIR
jgi:CubicO group peptidase (beta-lactamase class C family)